MPAGPELRALALHLDAALPVALLLLVGLLGKGILAGKNGDSILIYLPILINLTYRHISANLQDSFVP